MPTVFEKRNLADRDEIVVLNSPPSFETELAGFEGVRQVAIDEDWSAIRIHQIDEAKPATRFVV